MQKLKRGQEAKKWKNVVEGVSKKRRPPPVKKKYANFLKKEEQWEPSEMRGKIRHPKRRFKEWVNSETIDVVDANYIREKKNKFKRKSESVSSQMNIASSSSSHNKEHSSKYRQTLTDSSSSDDDLKLAQTSTKNVDIQNESSSDSSAVQTITSELKEERFKAGAGKRKGVETEVPTEWNDEPDELDRAMKNLHKTQTEISEDDSCHAAVPVEAETSDSSESESDEVYEYRLNRSFNKCKILPVSFHHLINTNKVLVFMRHPFTLFFKGVVNLTVLRGFIEVLGCVLEPGTNPKQTIYSPLGSCMLGIEASFADPPNSEEYEALEKTFEDLGLDMIIPKDVITHLEHRGCVILLERASPSPLDLYLKNVLPDQQVFSYPALKKGTAGPEFNKELDHQTAEAVLNCMFNFADLSKFHQFTKTTEWENVSHKVIRSNKEEAGACTVVCGGKYLGKSTYLRFLVNRHLAMFKEVLYLDFDPGQAEFTVPGCVSAVVVKEPLVGPNFTHITTPECMVYVGDMQLVQCPKRYLDSVEYVLNYCRARTDFQKMPWVVSTMGSNVGMGVDLTVLLLRMLKPRFVIQIESKIPFNNFPASLSPGYVWQFQSQFSSGPSIYLEYTHIFMKCCTDIPTSAKPLFSPMSVKTSFLCELLVLAYVSQFFNGRVSSLSDVTPYKVPFSKLTLSVLHTSVPHTHILSAMNANLVALCVYEGDDVLIPEDSSYFRILRSPTVCTCLGFGVVRGIDPVEKSLYLLTCLSEEKLSQVNCLMLGAVTLPSCVYTQVQVTSGHVPYVITGPGQKTSEGTKVREDYWKSVKRSKANQDSHEKAKGAG